MADVDVVVVGAGVLGRSIAYALARAEPALRIVVSGRDGPGASRAAGAMPGVLGEVTAAGLRARHGGLRLGTAVEAAARWPAWRAGVRERAGAAAPADGYGAGTYVLLNAASGPLDESALDAMRAAGARHGLPVEDSAVADVPAYRPLDNDRALRAVFLPQEHFLDARRWLGTLDAALRALPNVRRAGAGRLRVHGDAYELATGEGRFTAGRVVVAAGAGSSALLDGVDPELPVLPVVPAEGTAVTLHPDIPVPPVVLRTPNRAYACGLHAVPQADGSWYLGASAAPALRPGDAPTAGTLRFLLEAGLGQLHHGLAGARVEGIHHGNRPVGLDGHPLLGNAGRPGGADARRLRPASGARAARLRTRTRARETRPGPPRPTGGPAFPDRARACRSGSDPTPSTVSGVPTQLPLRLIGCLVDQVSKLTHNFHTPPLQPGAHGLD